MNDEALRQAIIDAHSDECSAWDMRAQYPARVAARTAFIDALDALVAENERLRNMTIISERVGAVQRRNDIIAELSADNERLRGEVERLSGGGTAASSEGEECEHRWAYFPTMSSNPEQRGRWCEACGEQQTSAGPTYFGDGTAPLPATDWSVTIEGRPSLASATRGSAAPPDTDLRAEIAAERDGWRTEAKLATAVWEVAEHRAEAAEVRVGEMREALRAIADRISVDWRIEPLRRVEMMAAVARAALGDTYEQGQEAFGAADAAEGTGETARP